MPPPQFFDIFGLASFTYITILAMLLLYKKDLPAWAPTILLMIGIGGLIIDGALVYTFYLQ